MTSNRLKVSDLCSEIIDCVNKTAPVVDAKTEFKMVRTPNVGMGFVTLEDAKCVEQEIFEKWSRGGRQLQKHDVILTREAPLGNVGIFGSQQKAFLGQRTVLYRPDKQKCDPYFLLAAFLAPDVQSQIQAFGSGATVAHMRVPDAKEIEINVPSLEQQGKIGSFVANLLNLIVCTNIRIENLENIANCLFKEWFVNFKFPGHEKVKLIDSDHPDFALIPETFRVCKLGSISSLITRGISPKYEDTSLVKVINQRCIRNHTIDLDLTRGNSKSFSSEKVLKQWDVLVNSTGVGTLGRAGIVSWKPVNLTCDSHVSIIRADQNSDPVWFAMSVLNCESYFERSGEGATGQTELSRERIGQAHTIYPPIDLQKQFATIVKPILELRWNLVLQIKQLSNARDLIVPKLISGDIDVSDINIENLTARHLDANIRERTRL